MITTTVFPQEKASGAATRDTVKHILEKAIKGISIEDTTRGLIITIKEKQVIPVIKIIYRSNIQWYTTDEYLEEQYDAFVAIKEKRKKKALRLLQSTGLLVGGGILSGTLSQIVYLIAEGVFHTKPANVPIWQYVTIFLLGASFNAIITYAKKK